MKLRKLFLAAGMALVAAGASAQTNIEDIRIYINPGHGSWGPNNRHMATIGHDPISTENPDTTDFFESNTNLEKCLEIFYRLKSYGFKHDGVNNALDLTQNLVMSRVASGPFPYSNVKDEALGYIPDDQNNAYNRKLSEIAAEVEANNFDMFISVHSNAATEGSTTNYLYFAYDNKYLNSSGTATSTEGTAIVNTSIAMSEKGWNHRILDRHTQWSHYDNLVGAGTVKIGQQNLGVLNHSVPGYLVEGYFHTYQPARHRAMNFDVDRLEGLDYARGVADYYGVEKESVGQIYGIVRDAQQKFTHDLYTPKALTADVYMPLNGVEVTLKQGETTVATYTTDVNYNGAFVFKDLQPGEYTVEFSHPDYKADTTYTWNSDRPTKEPAPIVVTVEAAKTAYPIAFIENKSYVPPTKVYVNYPDSTAGKAGFELAKYYEVKGTAYDFLAEQLTGKTVRRQIIREDRLYVLALDETNAPYIYLADLAAGTVTELDKAAIALGDNQQIMLSDIALTADHVLVGCSFGKNHYSDAKATEDNETRGVLQFYKWTQNETTKLPETCEKWFATDHSANFNRALAGKTLAYSGTLESGAVMTTMNSAGVNTMRVDLFPITEGVGDGTIFSYNKCGSFGKNVLGDDYELMVSPLAENGNIKTYVIDGSLTNASEFEMVDGANDVTVKGANALVNVKSNGANYFKYAGRSLMVAPKVNADGLVEGVQMFDITDGFSNAVEITLDGATIEPTAYTYASAHGELAITTNTADVTTDADIELFLAIDGKVTKFNVGDFYTETDIARGTINGTANPFAYALKSEIADNALKISYSLNADATDVNIIVKNAAGEEVATSAEGALAKGAYTAEISIADFEDGDYTWEISVAGAEKTKIERFSSVSFYHPSGLDVDNSFESPSFGTLFIAEGYTAGETTDYVSAQADGSEGGGLYMYNAAGEQILDKDGKSRFFSTEFACAGNNSDFKSSSSYYGADFARVRVAEDGRIFANRYVWKGNYFLSAASVDALVAGEGFTNLLADKTMTNSFYYDEAGNLLAGPAQDFDVIGAGEETKLLAITRNTTDLGAATSQNSALEYNIGTSLSLPSASIYTPLDQKYTISYTRAMNIEYDNLGGVWYCQYRSAPTDTDPALVYVDANGTVQYFEGAGGAARRNGAMSVSKDGKYLAAASAQGVLSVYKIVRDESGKVTLNEEHRLTHRMGNNLYDLAFGVGGNIYGSNASGELVDGYALPRSEAFTTKAAAKYGFTVGTSAIADVEAEEVEVAPVYYNLQGVQVENPANGIYIVKRGNKVTKEYVK